MHPSQTEALQPSAGSPTGPRPAPTREKRVQACPAGPPPARARAPPLSLACALPPEDTEQEDWEDQAGKARPLAARGAHVESGQTLAERPAHLPRVCLEGSPCLCSAAYPPARPARLTPGPLRARPCCFELHLPRGLALSRPELPPHTDTGGSAGAQRARQEVGRKALPPPGPQPQSCLCPEGVAPWDPVSPLHLPCPGPCTHSPPQSPQGLPHMGPGGGNSPAPGGQGGQVHCRGPRSGTRDLWAERAAFSPGLSVSSLPPTPPC